VNGEYTLAMHVVHGNAYAAHNSIPAGYIQEEKINDGLLL